MRWLADECVHSYVVHDLRLAGHDVEYAVEILRQSKDVSLADRARRDGRLLLTEDKDFGELAFGKSHPVGGIVLLRFPSARRALKSPGLLEVVAEYGDVLHGRFTVIEEMRTRSTPLGTVG